MQVPEEIQAFLNRIRSHSLRPEDRALFHQLMLEDSEYYGALVANALTERERLDSIKQGDT